MTKTKKRAPLLVRILWKFLVTLVTLIISLLCLVYVGEKLLFAPFFMKAQAEMNIPGLWTGFVAQGFDQVDENTYLVSGYDKDNDPSAIYVYDKGEYTLCELFDKDGAASLSHAGGVTHFNDFVYVATDTGEDTTYCDMYSLTDVLDGDGKATMIDRLAIPNRLAYCSVYDGKLYAGAFYREGTQYLTPESHHITTAAGDKNTALMMVYTLDERTGKPVNVDPDYLYSTTSNVQGFCFTDSGKIVLSTSWGLNPSKLFVYDETKAEKTTITLDGTAYETTVLDSECLTQTVTAPPMAEELVCENGRVTVMCESACMKYIFGKLTSGNYAYSVPIA